MFAVYIFVGMFGIGLGVLVVWAIYLIAESVVEKLLSDFSLYHKSHKYTRRLSILLAVLILIASYFVGRVMLS